MSAQASNLPIGIKLGLLAKSKGLTQCEIAQRCKISRLSVHRFFKGHTELKASDLMSVLEVLDISLASEIEHSLQAALAGQASKKDPIYRDVAVVLQSVSGQVRKTILEQISWWGRSAAGATPQQSTIRIQQYVQQMSKASGA